MTTLRLAIDSRPAERGARDYDRAVDRIDRGSATASRSVARLVAAIGGFEAVRRTIRLIGGFEQGLVGVAKTADLAGEDLAVLAEGIKRLAGELPTPTEELLALAQVAGQMGIKAVPSILAFTRAMAQMQGAAESFQGEDAALKLAQLVSIAGEAPDEIATLASVIVRLGNEMETTEGRIAEWSSGIGAATALFGTSSAEVAAFGAALSALDQNAEASGTVIGDTFRKIDAAVRSGGQSLERFAEIAGVSSAEFAEAYGESKVEGVLSFVDGLGRLKRENESVADALESVSLAGARHFKVLGAMGSRSDVVRKAFALVNSELADTKALEQEAARSADTLQGSWGRLTNAASVLTVNLGDQSGVAGGLRAVTDASGGALRILAGIANEQDKASVSAQSLAAATELATIGLLAYGGAKVLGAVRTLASSIQATAAQAVIAASAQQQLATGATLTAGAFNAASTSAVAATANIGRARAAMIGFMAVVRAHPIGLLVTALGAASLALGRLRADAKGAAEELDVLATAARDVEEAGRSFQDAIRDAEIAKELAKPGAELQKLEAQLRAVEEAYGALRDVPNIVDPISFLRKEVELTDKALEDLGIDPTWIGSNQQAIEKLRAKYHELQIALGQARDSMLDLSGAQAQQAKATEGQVSAVTRHIGALQQEALYLSLGEKNAARMEAVLGLLAAAREGGTKVTLDQIRATIRWSDAVVDASAQTQQATQGLDAALTAYDFKRSIADTIGNGFLEAARRASSARDIIQRIFDEITAIILRMKVIQPIVQGIIGAPPGQGGDPGGGGGVFPVESRMGNVFSNGDRKRFDLGGVINRRSYFRTRDGRLNSLAEGNRPEAIMPLKRDASGRLGVAVADRGETRARPTNITFNVFTPNADSFRESERMIRDRLKRAVN